jgi:hypothetical protein
VLPTLKSCIYFARIHFGVLSNINPFSLQQHNIFGSPELGFATNKNAKLEE